MNESVNYLEQAGLVTDSKNGRIKISLTGSGCSACHNSLCMLGDSKAKEVEINALNENWLLAGDEVIVKINPSSGYKAVALLYILPFFLMLLSIFIVSQSGYNEGIAGLTSLLMLVPYFGLLFLFRKKLRSQCTIEVEKR